VAAPSFRNIRRANYRRPGATALVFGNDRWTYARLNERANQIAHYLRGRRQERFIVALSMDRSAETIAALIESQAGGAYAPLDAKRSIDRRASLLADLAPVAILTNETLAQHWTNRLRISKNISSPDSLAYVMLLPDPPELQRGHGRASARSFGWSRTPTTSRWTTADLPTHRAICSTLRHEYVRVAECSTLAVMPAGLATLAESGARLRAEVQHMADCWPLSRDGGSAARQLGSVRQLLAVATYYRQSRAKVSGSRRKFQVDQARPPKAPRHVLLHVRRSFGERRFCW